MRYQSIPQTVSTITPDAIARLIRSCFLEMWIGFIAGSFSVNECVVYRVAGKLLPTELWQLSIRGFRRFIGESVGCRKLRGSTAGCGNRVPARGWSL